MNRKVTFTEEAKSRIKELIDKNWCLHKIWKKLEEEGICTCDRGPLKNFIEAKDGFNRKWDKKSKSWIINHLDTETPDEKSLPQPKYFIGEDQKLVYEVQIPKPEFDKNPDIHKKVESPDSTPESQPITNKDDQPASQVSPNPPPPPSGDIKQVLELCSSMRYEIRRLYDKIKSLENNIENLKDEVIANKQNTADKIYSIASEFISIYASEKNKKSISVNNKIMEKVVDMMKDKPYNIESNDSLAINTALLLALYIAKKPQNPDSE